jgi:hypothetical protein
VTTAETLIGNDQAVVFTSVRHDRKWTIGLFFTRLAADESAAVFVPPPASDLAMSFGVM